MHISLSSNADPAAHLSVSDFSAFADGLLADVAAQPSIADPAAPPVDSVRVLLASPTVSTFLVRASRADVFGAAAAEAYSASARDLCLLRVYKLLKYCYNLPCGQLLSLLAGVVATFHGVAAAKALRALADRALDEPSLGSQFVKNLVLKQGGHLDDKIIPPLVDSYEDNAAHLLEHDPHALFPTSIYRQCFGHVSSSADSKVIEGVMGTTITTTIEIVRDVLHKDSHHLRDVYKPLGRCVAVIDERVDGLYGDDVVAYFKANGIGLDKLVYRCMEVDKDISTVERILVDLKARRVSRNEPVLVMGGGVMADVGGFACALYHRNTPYVMLCTSIVSGIDAGPSPRTCCDGLGYKNVFGAYHPPILTLTDRRFFATLHPGWIRHGIAEIIKMAVTKDAALFDAVEQAGNQLVDTRFGIDAPKGSPIDELSDLIVAKAMDGYVRAEYGNLWETHQCRPHAYGHTWSPGFELQAGLLHGHAVAIGMGYGAYLSFLEGWISEAELHRILNVMSAVGLSLRHDILHNVNSIWSAQVKMTEKRGGNLCAPLPRGGIGKCGYLNDVSRPYLEKTLVDYQQLVSAYPRGGLGIDAHCHDVGLEDPSTVKQHAEHAVAKDDGTSAAVANGHVNGVNGSSSGGAAAVENGVAATPAPAPGPAEAAGVDAAQQGESAIDTYNKWKAEVQTVRNEGEGGAMTSSTLGSKMLTTDLAADTEHPPAFPHATLFHEGAEEYASQMTTLSSEDFVTVARKTEEAGLFAPCMVGKLEGQFLKMMAQVKGAASVLDIGTFTGYSALAFAEGVSAGGKVVTIEGDEETARVAQDVFSEAKHGDKITLIQGDAKEAVTRMRDNGEKFDIVFLDADKVNYQFYYDRGLDLLAKDGILMADNALCSLVYGDGDPARVALHKFAQFVKNDTRVEQVMLTVREGVLIVRKV